MFEAQEHPDIYVLDIDFLVEDLVPSDKLRDHWAELFFDFAEQCFGYCMDHEDLIILLFLAHSFIEQRYGHDERWERDYSAFLTQIELKEHMPEILHDQMQKSYYRALCNIFSPPEAMVLSEQISAFMRKHHRFPSLKSTDLAE